MENPADVYREMVGRFDEFMKTKPDFLTGSSFGHALNNEHERRTGKMSHSCFGNRFVRQYQEQRIKREKRESRTRVKEKSDLEKLMSRLAQGDLVAEKGLCYSLCQSGQEAAKPAVDMSYRAWWIGDCVAKAIIEKQGLALSEEDKEFWKWKPILLR